MDQLFPGGRVHLRPLHIGSLFLGTIFALGVPSNAGAQAHVSKPLQPAPGHRLDADKVNRSIIGIQYSNFFTEGAHSWETAETVPILGKYSSYDVGVLKQHFQWFQQLAIDWLLIDWTNILWSTPAWDKRVGVPPRLEKSVGLMFQTSLNLEKEGKYAPKMVIELGLREGIHTANEVEQLNEVIDWIDKKYLDRPGYENLWLYHNGKPLLIIFYVAKDPCRQLPVDLRQTPLAADRWTVQWMSAQLQTNHADECGMWSWMDGTIEQKVTEHSGRAEEVVVTPASFDEGGWLGTSAVGRDHGVPYLNSWRVAFARRPKFIQIHQWNEFAGQEEEGLTFYGDEYNIELSDDIEPTQSKACTRRGCGGWGYYFMNLTHAVVSLYRGETPDITVLALSTPKTQAAQQKYLELHWSVLGRQPKSYSILLDRRLIAAHVIGTTYRLDLTHVSPGVHRATVVAVGTRTYFDLDPRKPTTRSTSPLPVHAEFEFKN